jgi:hypothetical protein
MWTYADPAAGLVALVGFAGRGDTGWPARCFVAFSASCLVQAGAIVIAPQRAGGGDAAADSDDSVLPAH